MEIKVISRETIKPSVPTPSHLRTFNLSLLDQICVSWYTPIIFFYQKPAITSQQGKSVTTRLKTSLSEALSRFYPLAGRIKDDVSIDCNDEGALFTQAQVNCDLSQFLEQPNLDLLHLFLDPSLDLWNVLVPTSAVQVAVQVGIFACGGISLSICFLHRIADAVTFRSFLMYWAAISAAPAAGSAAANAIDQYPDFSVASKLFPPKDSLPNDLKPLIQHIWKFKLGKSVRRRFVFDAKAISALKLEVVSTSKLTKPPSDVLVVSGLIWKHAMAAASELDGSRKHSNSTLAFPVNLRPRMVQPFSPNSSRNLILLVVA